MNITGGIVWLVVIIFIISKVVDKIKQRQKLNIDQRWVLVTRCDSGIGLGVVKKLVAENASVIAFTYTQEGAERALTEGAKLAPRLDITDEAAVRKAVEQVREVTAGKLWGLVHNAGAVQPGFIE